MDNISKALTDFDSNISFKDLLKSKIQSAGDREIIRFHGTSYTWNDIDSISDVVALDLLNNGVKKGTHVGLCGMNSANWVFTFFAIQKLGAVSVFVNYHWKPNEVAACAFSANVTHFCYGEVPYDISEDEYIKEISNSYQGSIDLFYNISNEVDFTKRADGSITLPDVNTVPSETATMIFTSGSTSVPNVVCISADKILEVSKRLGIYIHQNDSDVSCQVLPIFHLFGFEQFLHSAIGNIPTCFPKSVHSGDILQAISDEKCTILHSVPNMFVAIASHKSFKKYDVSHLRASLISGAGILPFHMQMLFEKFPNNHFMKFFGMSEIGIVAVSNYNDSTEHILNSTGHADKDVEIVIVDPDTEEVCESGVEGEILIRSPRFQSYYYSKDGKGPQKVDRNGFFHCGDMGVLSADGYLFISGRKKDIIIRSGENISPAEVAAAISNHPLVANVEVLPVPNDFYGEEVAACIITENHAELEAEELKEFLADKLASFKLPSYYLFLDEFPLLGSGKTDKITLKKLLKEKFYDSSASV